MATDGVFLVNVADVEGRGGGGRRDVPGLGEIRGLDGASIRFLGRETKGPWVYYSERTAGASVPWHSHRADRIEFVIEGKLRWSRPHETPRVHGAGTLNRVTAGTVYGYEVAEHAKILTSFAGPPGTDYAESAPKPREGGVVDGVYVTSLAEVEDLSGNGEAQRVPGVGRPQRAPGPTRFLGRSAKDGPWVYHIERSAGALIPLHKHKADRIEFVLEGRIEWTQPGEEPTVYGAGTLSHVKAETVYGYRVLEDAKILISFDGPPGVTYA
jgi:quercetin dioxygenase-like cupin family protein